MAKIQDKTLKINTLKINDTTFTIPPSDNSVYAFKNRQWVAIKVYQYQDS